MARYELMGFERLGVGTIGSTAAYVGEPRQCRYLSRAARAQRWRPSRSSDVPRTSRTSLTIARTRETHPVRRATASVRSIGITSPRGYGAALGTRCDRRAVGRVLPVATTNAGSNRRTALWARGPRFSRAGERFFSAEVASCGGVLGDGFCGSRRGLGARDARKSSPSRGRCREGRRLVAISWRLV